MAQHSISYRRPLSEGELRDIRRQKRRAVMFCGVAVSVVLTGMIGLLKALYEHGLR